jgi:transcriptional regulator with XRE-family HTH domain
MFRPFVIHESGTTGVPCLQVEANNVNRRARLGKACRLDSTLLACNAIFPRQRNVTKRKPRTSNEVAARAVMVEIDPAIKRLGQRVAEYRMRLGVQQNQIQELVTEVTRTEIAHLEEGRALPLPDRLEAICSSLKMPRALWYAATHPQYLRAMRFERTLSELVGRPVNLDNLDPLSAYLCVDIIEQALRKRMSPPQAHAHFNSILTFYGERSVSLQFFSRFFGSNAFENIDRFVDKVVEFQKIAIRMFGSFRQAFQTLRTSRNLDVELAVVAPIDQGLFTQRRPFEAIRKISDTRLDDLGYISAERVRRESRERHELYGKLAELSKVTRSGGVAGNAASEPRRLHRIQTLLRKFGSRLEVENTLFSALDADELEREAKRLAPADIELTRIAETQDAGQRNLSVYLTEPYMDVYVATSMRERADFVSVNTFVESLFSNAEISHLHLRYFNPTQSWVDDRVAKGLVEALMLRRSAMTIYMAQKSDTFGKDSEASVALGQGKPVLVYVPKLRDEMSGIDSEVTGAQDQASLELTARGLGLSLDEGLDRTGIVSTILTHQLDSLAPDAMDRVIRTHWADFDLYGELNGLPPTMRELGRAYLDGLSNRVTGPNGPITAELRAALIERVVSVAVRFEARGRTFKEIHPLALQVILSSGVLNGIIVVRSVPQCARIMYQLLTNQLETDLVVDDQNYKLVEKVTRSTLRVISKHRLLTNAFWTQYFPEIS